MFDIDAVIAKSDLLAYVERAGGKLKGNGDRYSCACPIHGGDNPTAFSLFRKEGKWFWNCFTGTCGGGDVITFVEVWQGFQDTTRDGKKLSAFRQACEWINGGEVEDAEGMQASAEKRLEAARLERVAAQEREEARRKELVVAEIHLRYHKNMTQWMKDKWTVSGIDEGMQEFWTLGGCEDFPYRVGEQTYHSPTLTIPIFNENKELLTIKHRLLDPHDPKDKYRPERSGLHSHPFLAVPEMGYDGEIVWVMEGEKKAMVTWTKCHPEWQCIGVPSQEGYKALVDKVKDAGVRVIAVPDPNTASNPSAFKKAYDFTKAVGGKILKVTEKIDDMILTASLGENDLLAMAKQARSVR